MVQRTAGISFSGQYNTVGGQITQTSSSTAAAVTYTFTLARARRSARARAASSRRRPSGTGTVHPTAGDTYTVTYTTGGADLHPERALLGPSMSTRLLSCALLLACAPAALAAGTGADPALLEAARSGDLAALRAQLEAGADVNAAGPTAPRRCIEAAVHGRSTAAEALIAAGADLDANRRGYGSAARRRRAGRPHGAGRAPARQGRAPASGRTVGDTVCVRPWDGDGYCGTVEACEQDRYRIHVTEVVGCERGLRAARRVLGRARGRRAEGLAPGGDDGRRP